MVDSMRMNSTPATSGIKSLAIDAGNQLPFHSGSMMTPSSTLTETQTSLDTGQRIRYLEELSYLIVERAGLKHVILPHGLLQRTKLIVS